MAEVTLTAVVDDSHMIHLELPPEIVGEVEIVVKERKGNGAAILQAIAGLPPRTDEDAEFWRRAREELYRDRDAWDES